MHIANAFHPIKLLVYFELQEGIKLTIFRHIISVYEIPVILITMIQKELLSNTQDISNIGTLSYLFCEAIYSASDTKTWQMIFF